MQAPYTTAATNTNADTNADTRCQHSDTDPYSITDIDTTGTACTGRDTVCSQVVQQNYTGWNTWVFRWKESHSYTGGSR